MIHLKNAFATMAAVCLITTLFTSCKKSGADSPDTATSDTYQPLTLNSTWKYATDYPAVDTTVMTMSSSTQTYGGKSYHVVQSKAKVIGNANTYFYNGNHVYNWRNSSAGAGDIDFTYLNDTAKVNYTWKAKVTDDGTISGIPAQMLGKIIATGISKTVAGKAYTNVIHTTVQLQYALTGSTYSTFATYDFYVAKGIGIIEMDASTYGVKSTFKLLSYTIK
ncbi:hypothetical protein [Mucilaginibacter agri]|uniref:Uncharacterized protein n=1 Tax=Mucilaginibacter agri TaxID=2695265 RepID=A0A966DV95_9SPHI|nr:hypothetical protein [Mucilaginibacter agri]NCD70329.1 hypothetical protein [Mucilaginibacter agri]